MLIFALLSFLFFLIYATLIIYYWRGWNSIPDFNAVELVPATKISVIIAARNEEKNIIRLLNSLSQQSYPKNLWEIIIIDDHSTDNMPNLLSNFPSEKINLRRLQLSDHLILENPTKSYKKLAIEIGINKASGDLIVTTDADCTFTKDWLQTIACFYQSTSAKFIAAPVKIQACKNLLSIFQTLDFITLQGITGASVYKKFHSMCNGANLAYEKKIFFKVDGFENIDNIPSGDDMFLMHKIYKEDPDGVFFLKNKNAIVSTLPESSWKDFLNQRIRWASKADHYDDKRIFWVLLFVYLFNLMFLVLLVASCWNINCLFILLSLFILKIIIEFPFARSVSSFFDQQKMMRYFLLLQPLHIIYTLTAGWLGKFGKYDWKGRTIRK